MRIHLLALLFLVACQSLVSGEDPTARPFHDELAPYGEWLERAPHGRVWSPDPAIVGDDFMPYLSGGRWHLSSHGWLWVSSWSWGWAPFHHGRWLLDDAAGWLWIPDREWAPAWVAWRAAEGQVGWAPLPPTSGAQRSHWVFVRARDLTAETLPAAVIRSERARRLFQHSAPLLEEDGHDGVRWYRGPGAGAFAPDPLPEAFRIKPPHRGELLPPRVDKDAAKPDRPRALRPARLPAGAILERVLPID
jgi:hypothetical protein